MMLPPFLPKNRAIPESILTKIKASAKGYTPFGTERSHVKTRTAYRIVRPQVTVSDVHRVIHAVEVPLAGQVIAMRIVRVAWDIPLTDTLIWANPGYFVYVRFAVGVGDLTEWLNTTLGAGDDAHVIPGYKYESVCFSQDAVKHYLCSPPTPPMPVSTLFIRDMAGSRELSMPIPKDTSGKYFVTAMGNITGITAGNWSVGFQILVEQVIVDDETE